MQSRGVSSVREAAAAKAQRRWRDGKWCQKRRRGRYCLGDGRGSPRAMAAAARRYTSLTFDHHLQGILGYHGSGVPPNPPCNPRAFKKTSKRNKQTDHLPLAWPANFDCRPSPMPCANMDAPLREDSAAGGGGVEPIAVRLRRRPSRPDAGGEPGFEAKDAGSMVARLRQEG